MSDHLTEPIEKFFKCPFCLEKISMVLEVNENGEHSYIEDCEVCCHPIQLQFVASKHKITRFKAFKAYE